MSNRIQARPARRQGEHRTPAVAWIVGAREQSLPYQSLDDAGQGAGMDVQFGRQVTRRYPWEQPHNPQHQPLWAGDADLCGHPLGCAFDAMDNRPQELHELQDVWQREQPGGISGVWHT
jgi:hypothetical protein